MTGYDTDLGYTSSTQDIWTHFPGWNYSSFPTTIISRVLNIKYSVPDVSPGQSLRQISITTSTVIEHRKRQNKRTKMIERRLKWSERDATRSRVSILRILVLTEQVKRWWGTSQPHRIHIAITTINSRSAISKQCHSNSETVRLRWEFRAASKSTIF